MMLAGGRDFAELFTDSNRTRSRQFRDDLLRLLGLSPGNISINQTDGSSIHSQNQRNHKVLDDILPDVIPRIKPDFSHFSRREQRRKDRFKVNLCQDQYAPIRNELIKNAQEASLWIRTSGFLSSPDVTVSSPEYFEALLKNWMVNPCEVNDTIS